MFSGLYNHLGDSKTISIIALVNGFISGYAVAYTGLITLKGVYASESWWLSKKFQLGIFVPLIGIMVAILFKYLAVFVVDLLPVRIKPIFGLVLLLSTVMFTINSFKNFVLCTVNASSVIDKKLKI